MDDFCLPDDDEYAVDRLNDWLTAYDVADPDFYWTEEERLYEE